MQILYEITCIFNFCRVNSETQPRYLVFFFSIHYLSIISSIVLGTISFRMDMSQPSSVRIYRFFEPCPWLPKIRNRRSPPQVMAFEHSDLNHPTTHALYVTFPFDLFNYMCS